MSKRSAKQQRRLDGLEVVNRRELNAQQLNGMDGWVAGRRWAWRIASGLKINRMVTTGNIRQSGYTVEIEIRCHCGNQVFRQATYISRRQSCGCREGEINPAQTHGLSAKQHRVYRIWCGMRDRCANLKNKLYHYYGGRGIDFDPAWNDFAKFFEDMGDAPSIRHTLDRVDNMSGYSKANCHWATYCEQQNNRRSNRYVLVAGELLTFAQAVRKHAKHGLTYGAVWQRVKTGRSIESALSDTRGCQ